MLCNSTKVLIGWESLLKLLYYIYTVYVWWVEYTYERVKKNNSGYISLALNILRLDVWVLNCSFENWFGCFWFGRQFVDIASNFKRQVLYWNNKKHIHTWHELELWGSFDCCWCRIAFYSKAQLSYVVGACSGAAAACLTVELK